MKSPHNHLNSRWGVALVEAGFTLLLFLIALIGVMETGRAWMNKNLLTHAVREGTRLAVVTPDLVPGDARIIARINTLLAGGGLIPVAPPTIAFVGGSVRGTMVTVRAQVNFQPVFSAVFGSTAAIPLVSQVVARHE